MKRNCKFSRQGYGIQIPLFFLGILFFFEAVLIQSFSFTSKSSTILHRSKYLQAPRHESANSRQGLFEHYSVRSHLESIKEKANKKKYIAVTGGVISGIGKGVTASSIGVVLKALNIQPTAIKIDPYLNVDAGTMSPTEHGEVFVLDDGSETDLDLGNYERFLDVKLTNDSNLTTGKIYQSVILKERRGDYLGKTVQIIPHITNEIIERIVGVTQTPVDENNIEPDIVVIELGGTIGDIESMPFVEALRQLRLLVRPENFCLVHVSMVPTVGDDGEQKTKPTQHSVKELRSLGLNPDFIVCRSKTPIYHSSAEKIALFCNVPSENVLSIHDVNNIYYVPLLLLKQNFHQLLDEKLQLKQLLTRKSLYAKSENLIMNQEFLSKWENIAKKTETAQDVVKIVLVAKYVKQSDSYLSVISSLKHSSSATDQKLVVTIVDSTHLEDSHRDVNPDEYKTAWKNIKQAHGILVPGGFGLRGIEGKISAINYAREQKIPFLGICLGMQLAVIEYSRNVLNKKKATSEEFAPSEANHDDHAVIFMPEIDPTTMGGTMRLGVRKTIVASDKSLAYELYQKNTVLERHRHRYEVNPAYVSPLEEKGLIFSGKDEKNERMEIIELSKEDHPFYIAAQFHPEFLSRPLRPSPIFLGFLTAIKGLKDKSYYQSKF